ncbi:MAG TPA: zf-HC2 domain-containing protein [Pyrinomonadaceae bacterium]|nr:zf-HC2 domain-containing protein [Pyrinomonadaceae bacterium]
MNCENCQNFLSSFLDGELDETSASHVKAHLSMCVECAEICEDFASIIGFCGVPANTEIQPPNSQALWCRINNIIETEIKPEMEIVSAPKPSRLSLLWSRTWALSLTQAVSAAMGVAVVSSLLTVVAIKNFVLSDNNEPSAAAPSTFEKFLGQVGVIDTPQAAREKRLKEQQIAIEYWNKRVESRRQQWDKNIRAAFERNLSEINEAVAEYNQILETNPQDEISSEMLDTTLNEKMELLRQFSEL